MVILIAGLIFLNAFFYLFLILGWLRLPQKLSDQKLSFSVIIPVRNEEGNITNILRSLAYQGYPKSNYEVIVIDDFSEDNTKEQVALFKANSDLSVLFYSLNAEDGQGKKTAITKGVALSKFDHIITTDADCTMGNAWLNTYARHFSDNQILAGPVSIQSDSMFSKLQQIEFAGLIGFGAVTISRDDPSMCSGANLGFKKEAFKKVGGYENNIEIPSGDDEFLLYNIHHAYPGKAAFIKDKKAVVRTSPHKTLKSFTNQRKRWTSKWKYNKNRKLRVTAILFFFENISFLSLCCMMFLGWLESSLLLSLLASKFLLIATYLNLVNRFMGNSFAIISPLIFQIFYPFHVLLMGLNSIFGTYTWKGRKY